MVEIPLTRGMVAMVDDADVPVVQGRKWYAMRDRARWYACAVSNDGGPKLRMSRLILPGVPMIDHKNGNGLDNRRENLRPCTYSQNGANQSKTHGSSRYKGVSWEASRGRWKVSIEHFARQTFLGYFDDESAAALAYNAAALDLFGEFARINVITDASRREGEA